MSGALEVERMVATLRLPAGVLRADDWEAVGAGVTAFASDAGLRVLVLRGTGADFCLGADVADVRARHATGGDGDAFRRMTRRVLEDLASVPKPTLAAMRGSCRGGGCAVATACDLRLGDDTASFEFTAAALGIVYPLLSTRLLVDVVGPARARRLLLEGTRVGAVEAERFGLLDEVTPPAALDARVAARAGRLADLSQRSHQAHKAFVARIAAGRRAEDAESRATEGAGYSEKPAARLTPHEARSTVRDDG